jgi:RimJ/RimL family protein N-acetyltransferase
MKNAYEIGNSIYLRAPTLEDANGDWYQWFSDPDTTEFLGDQYWPNTVESQIECYESTRNSKDRLVLSVCLKENDEHVGVCSLSDISWLHRCADIAFVVGKKEHRNGTIGVEIMTLLLRIAFNRLNLINLRAGHLASNPYTPLLMKMFGFKQVARFEEFCFSQGEYVDLIFSQLSKKDWMKRNKVST